jgi:hypothetical protein
MYSLILFKNILHLYLQQINNKSNKIFKIARNDFGKYVYSTEVHISTPVNFRE